MPEKLKMHSPDLVAENIEKIAEFFPNCVTEAEGEDGQVTRKIDFDLLRQELSDEIVEGPLERYHLNWPGKRETMLAANAPVAKTLRPHIDESVDFDTTKNLFIEGDNLEALKLLQETYLGRVKLIYIDPPYNTGKDFVYNDHFAQSTDDYLLRSDQAGDSKLVANTETNGRFHSDWLCMLYSRLKLARNLLRNDGVLAISIDDNEATNAIKCCNEIFGEANFVATISNTNNPKGRSDDKHVATAHEYVLLYSRDASSLKTFGFEPGNEIIRRYNKTDSDGKKYREIDLRKTGDSDLREDRPNLFYYFYFNEESGELAASRERIKDSKAVEIVPLRADGKEGRWRWELDTAKTQINRLTAVFMPSRKTWSVFERDYLENRGRVKATSSWTFKDVNSERGTEQFIQLGFDKRVFQNPKPIGTVQRLIEIVCPESGDDLIVDFFAGSATTAHAVLQQNAADGGNRRFLLVQTAEKCEEDTVASKEGFQTIAEIAKERIRRAVSKITDEHPLVNQNCDHGFRVLKVDSSNMKDVYYSPADTSQEMLRGLVDNIKPDRSGEDLLFQVLLDCGVDLGLPIRVEKINDREVFFVNDSEHASPDLIACFDAEVPESLVKTIAGRTPLRAVFREHCFTADDAKINVEQIFKQMSPQTQLKSL